MNPLLNVVDEETAFLLKALPLTNAMGLLATAVAEGAESERFESAVMDALLGVWECPVGNATRASRQSMTVSALSPIVRLAGDRRGPVTDARNAALVSIGDHVTRWSMRLMVEAARPSNATIVEDHEREMRADLERWRAVQESGELGLPIYVTKILWDVVSQHETADSVTRARLAMRWTVCLVAMLARTVASDDRLAHLERTIYHAEVERKEVFS